MLSLNKYKYFDTTVQGAENTRQKFYFCRLPLTSSLTSLLCAGVLCYVLPLVFYQNHSGDMIGYFDRTNVALEKNQLDWRTDQPLGQ